MKIIAIDPGTTESGYVVMDGMDIVESGIAPNDETILNVLDIYSCGRTLAIEMIASYGMAVGASTFETCVWIGRFTEHWQPRPYQLIYRKDAKMHLCRSMRAKDKNIRQAIMDKYGSERSIAIGTKKNQGPLYGISKHMWSALAVGLTSQNL